MSKFAKGDPYAKGSAAYMRSLLPPEPQLNLNVHDPAHVDQVVNFNPDPTLADKIFNSLYDPCASLASIACDHDITLETLTAWLARPDIAERLANLEGACAMRLRLNTVNRLHLALDACTTILREYNDAACYEAAIREGKASQAKEHIRRDRETARKTSLLMLRLATFDPTKPRRHNTRTRPNSNSETEVQTLQSRTGAAPIITTISNPTFNTPSVYTMTFAAPGFDDAAGTYQPLRAAIDSDSLALNAPPTTSSIPHPTSHIDRAAGSIVTAASPAATTNQPDLAAAPPQAEGLTVHSRGWSESASDTPGTDAPIPPHPEGVHEATLNKRRGDSPLRTTGAPPSTPRTDHGNPARLNE